MVELRLHGEQVQTVFDLLGKKENDITYSLGWALSQSDRLATALLEDVFPGDTPGELRAVRLQEFLAEGGYTDIEVESERFDLILEAKRGWNLPSRRQLTQYAPRLHGKSASAILVVSECSPDFARHRLPKSVDGVRVAYRSWKQVAQLVETWSQGGTHAEGRLLRELVRYLRGLMSMQNQTSNRVYVVSLGAKPTSWSGSLTPIQIVTEKGQYFHQIGGGYPKDPPNYVGFRWGGRLQQINPRG